MVCGLWISLFVILFFVYLIHTLLDFSETILHLRSLWPSLSLNNLHYKCAIIKKLYCREALQTLEMFKKEAICWVQALRSYESLKLFPYTCIGEPIQTLRFEVNCQTN